MKLKTSFIPIILGAIALLLAIPLSVFLTSQKNVGETRTKARSEEIQISFFPKDPSQPFTVGNPIEVRVLVDTKGSTLGTTDVLINYDPRLLFINDEGILGGTTHRSYPGRFVDASQNLIGISADGNFTGTGTFATLKFIALKKGMATLSFKKVFSESLAFQTDTTSLEIK